MGITKESRLQDIYLTGVEPNGKDIGIGSYGRVFEVECFGTVYAAKEIHSILVRGVRREEFEATKKAFLTECVRSSSLGHPNIVTFLGVYATGGQSLLPVLVMERMQESLTSVVEKYPSIPMYVKLSMLSDVSQGLWYLHGHHPSIVHRDLSPNNVLLTNQLVAKISDLGVAKVMQADSKKTKTCAPGTIDFMPPEALLETPEYGPPLDIFSYAGVILHVVNQKWPKPLHYVMTDPKTGKMLALSEIERRQQHMEKMTRTPADLQPLVEQCLDNQPSRRPPVSDVSQRMKRMKEVEHVRCPHVNMNPTTWQQVEQTTKMLREATITAAISKVQQPATDSQVNIFRKTVKWNELAPLPVYRIPHTAVLLGGVIYVGGGDEGRNFKECQSCYRLDAYSLATNQWSSSPIITPYRYFAMTTLDDKLVTAGGLSKSNEPVRKVLVLKPGQWKDYSDMPTARYDATAVGYHSMLIVVGGGIKVKGKWIQTPITELLDTTTGHWYTCNNLPLPCQQMKAAIMNDKLYLLGGVEESMSSSQMFVASLDTLSNHQVSWQSAPNTPWICPAPVVLYERFLLAVGGIRRFGCASEMCVFDASIGQWKQLTNIPEERSYPVAVGVADNTIIMIGGANDDNKFTNTM